MLPYYPARLPLNFGGLEEPDSGYEQARVIVWPIPLERTTTYKPGTRYGPAAILDASRNMELYDEELQAEPFRCGIHTLPEMETQVGTIEKTLADLHTVASGLLADGKFVVALGGEHSLTPPIVAACAKKFPNLSVLQIDAHADLRDTYEGSGHSHACAMRRVLEICPAVQVGIRSLSREEAGALPHLSNTRVFYAQQIVGQPPEKWVPEVIQSLSDTVYVTLDVDGLDPSLVPATGTPEPGGLGWYELLRLLREVAAKKTIVAADLVELSPQPGLHACEFLCARLAYKMVGYVLQGRAG
ncbi:MAG: agmatinase [Acidobacteria bacterium RIFCSPLOWO2_12_FULL_59_11]|nr:MAG: agmatinase [Acidobacteria bacterium RIFCSPLOWO2_12_FULL_59_11]